MSATVETKKDVLKELDIQVSLLRRQVTAEKKVNDHIAGQVKQLGDNMELLRTFAEEDANTIAGLLDRQKSLEDGYQAMIVALEEIRDAVNVFASAEPTISPEEEKMYSFLGIEAPASKWKKIVSTVVATLAASAALYYCYKYFNRPEESIGVGVAKL